MFPLKLSGLEDGRRLRSRRKCKNIQSWEVADCKGDLTYGLAGFVQGNDLGWINLRFLVLRCCAHFDCRFLFHFPFPPGLFWPHDDDGGEPEEMSREKFGTMDYAGVALYDRQRPIRMH
jgi:hypothetical protein